MRTVPCPDRGRPVVELGGCTVGDTEYARLPCGAGPAVLLAAGDFTSDSPTGASRGPDDVR